MRTLLFVRALAACKADDPVRDAGLAAQLRDELGNTDPDDVDPAVITGAIDQLYPCP